jgi:hypothetical protein
VCLIYGFDLCDFVIDVAGENRERKRGWRKHRERERERDQDLYSNRRGRREQDLYSNQRWTKDVAVTP